MFICWVVDKQLGDRIFLRSIYLKFQNLFKNMKAPEERNTMKVSKVTLCY